jgi:hypothetical protein
MITNPSQVLSFSMSVYTVGKNSSVGPIRWTLLVRLGATRLLEVVEEGWTDGGQCGSPVIGSRGRRFGRRRPAGGQDSYSCSDTAKSQKAGNNSQELPDVRRPDEPTDLPPGCDLTIGATIHSWRFGHVESVDLSLSRSHAHRVQRLRAAPSG